MEPYTSFFRFLSGYIMDYNSACDYEKREVLNRLEDAITVARFFNQSIKVYYDKTDEGINSFRMFLTTPEENGEVNWFMYHYDAELLEFSYYSRGRKYLICFT